MRWPAETSRMAYDTIRESGYVNEQMIDICESLKELEHVKVDDVELQYPTDRELLQHLIKRNQYKKLRGVPNDEIIEWSGKINAVSGRRKDLVTLGLIKQHGSRKCAVTGFTAKTWNFIHDEIVVGPKKHSHKCKHCHGTGYEPTEDELYNTEFLESFKDTKGDDGNG